MQKEVLGLRIVYFPDKIIVGAIASEGTMALNSWITANRDASVLRIKLGIGNIEWPHLTIDQLRSGQIYRVTFTK